YWSRTSATIRTARSRNSGGYFLELTDFILPQEVKSPDPPGRFRTFARHPSVRGRLTTPNPQDLTITPQMCGIP
ncbi:hypothetical protein, partial [Nocardia farcinica]|uniref:hypothetical protein n=1 Tax=Nocardia farcinica TaxID=37329 RepID=UPI001E580416